MITDEELTSDDFIETVIDYYQYQINASRYEVKENIKDENGGSGESRRD